MSLNRIVLIGRLTKDPEMKYSPQGVAVTHLSIAVNRVTKDENGNYETDFFNVVAFRRTAEFVSNYLTKGRLISVDGRLQSRSWIAQDGTKRTIFEVIADNIEGLDRRDEAAHSPSVGDMGEAPVERAAPASPPSSSPSRTKPASAPADDDLDEVDPFADE